MASPANVSCASLDDTFGPYAEGCRGGFDFTLLFEESVLVLLPAALGLLAILPRGWFLVRRSKKISAHQKWATVKISAWLSLGTLQLASLILWASPSAARTRISLATAIISLLSSLALCVLSYLEHDRTIRPSTLLGTFLLATLLFDVAHTRTLWLRSGNGVHHLIAQVHTTGVVVKSIILVLEAWRKRRLLRPEYKFSPAEATSSIFDRSFFAWLNPLFYQGFGRILAIEDLFALDKHLQTTYLTQRFRNAWDTTSRKKTKTSSLILTSFSTLKWIILQTVPIRFAQMGFNFCQPFLINRAIHLSQEAITERTTQIGYGLIGAYLLVYLGIAVSTGQYQHRTYRTITMVRGGLISIIYRKTGSLSLKDLDPAASMTVMSADIERIVTGWQSMHEIWAALIEVGIAIYLLEIQLGVACVVPIAVSMVSLLGSLIAMKSIMSRQAMWLEAIERRISATSAMLNSMKGIKMCGLQETLEMSLQKLRVEELDISKHFRRLIIWNMVFAYLTQVFAPVLTFVIFAIASRGGDRTLDTAVAFTALSLFALLSEPLAALIMSLATFLGAMGSFSRIQQFLQSEERVDMRYPNVPEEKGQSATEALAVREANFGWDPAKEPLLKGMNLSIPWQKLTMVVGPVGCGKSTLLLALLGEIPALAGSVRLGSSSVAYCAQSSWHMNGTVRDAIVGCEGFDELWYSRVIRACALLQDFDELPAGDSSRLGSGGLALSGGQSQRISLARAVYARREIILLDDILSGLDTTTESHVFTELIGEGGILHELGSTVVLVSSSAKRLPYAHHIISLDANGKIVEQGSFAELDEAGGYVASFHLRRADWSYTLDHDGETTDEETDLSAAPCKEGKDFKGFNKECHSVNSDTHSVGGLSRSETACSESGEELESRRTGDVKIYMYYVRSVGWWAALLFVVAMIGFVFCVSFPTIWVGWWAAENETHPDSRLGYWLGIYAMLGGVAIISLFISCWSMIITMVPQSGEKFHLALLKTVLRAPMSFFANTDVGVTLNRFSQDLQLIDMELPIAALNTFATFIMVIAQMILIGIGSIYSAVAFPAILGVLYLVQKFYLRTSRQIRLLDIEAKAPLYSLFEESLSGLATIRAFGWQSSLEDRNHELLDRSQRPFYLLFAIQRWLTLVLDLVVAAVAVLLIILVVQLRGTLSAGGVGLALVNVIQFSQTIKMLLTFWTNLETHIGSVARVKSFTKTTAAEDRPGEDGTPPPNWPGQGAIEFENVATAYKADNLVIKNVTFDVKAGEKIGICGRTGSGKTSLITSLFRLMDLRCGAIRIDGVDISTLPRAEIRRRVIGVPQQAFMLKGSVRLNADPWSETTDEAITEALQCVQLWKTISAHGGLDADIDAVKLSGGQMQLFCLARAMLRKSSILVLDEATSSIDGKTQEIIQRLIRKKFASHTIIAVAHRLETIMDFDKVAVMDAGRLVEYDNPYALLEAPGSSFSRLYDAAMNEDWDYVDEQTTGKGQSSSGTSKDEKSG